MPDILDRIVESKWAEVEGLRGRETELEDAAAGAPAPRSFARALSPVGEVAVIAEVKRRSPGAGDIRPDLDPVELAASYCAAGAAALSVLTDAPWFGGTLDDLRRVRGAVAVPVLRKDFIVDRLQVFEARAAGADAILLIVRILDDTTLKDLLRLGESLGMGVLVEVHGEGELARALAAGAHIIGVNNRDLQTFTTRLEVTETHLASIPTDRIVVSESGLRTRDDVTRVGRAGVHAVLVGEAFLRAPDPGTAAAGMVGCPRQPRGPQAGG